MCGATAVNRIRDRKSSMVYNQKLFELIVFDVMLRYWLFFDDCFSRLQSKQWKENLTLRFASEWERLLPFIWWLFDAYLQHQVHFFHTNKLFISSNMLICSQQVLICSQQVHLSKKMCRVDQIIRITRTLSWLIFDTLSTVFDHFCCISIIW